MAPRWLICARNGTALALTEGTRYHDQRHHQPSHDDARGNCPTWCELPVGHPYLDVDSVDCYRNHRVSFGAEVRVYEEETICGLGRAWINADVSIDEGSADDAEQLARQLRAAALRLRGTTQQDPSVNRDTRRDQFKETRSRMSENPQDSISADDIRAGVQAHVVNALSRSDIASITTPVGLLTPMLYDLGFQMAEAHAAASRLLHRVDDQALWQDVQLLTTHATTGANYIWARRRRLRDPSPYPQRARDIQHLLQVTEGELVNVRHVRDGIAHLDEKFERWVSRNPGEPFGMRFVHDGPPGPGSMLAWERISNALWFLDTRVDVVRLATELALIQQRASAAFFLMLNCTDS